MQIRTDDHAFNKCGCPSRPTSPTALLAPLEETTTAGNELGEIDIQTTGSQPERESHPQQPRQQQQSSTSPLPFLPELIDHVVDHLHDDKQSLIQCSKTSKVFSHATSYHLFRTISVPSVRRCLQFQELIRSSLHPLPLTPPDPHPSPSSSSSTSSTSATSTSPPTSCTTCHQTAQTHPQSHYLHPHSLRANASSHTTHTHTSACDVPTTGWDISKFVRKIEFYWLDAPSSMEEYVSEAVKLVGMLPRIREAVFGWWMQVHGLERIGRAFATTTTTSAGHHDQPSNQPRSSVPPNRLSETGIEQKYISDPLKLHLDLVDFDSVRTFLDFLGSFGGRLRELSLSSVTFGDGGSGKDAIKGLCFPGLESVCLDYGAVFHPKRFGQDGPTMGAMMNTNMLFGMRAFDLCEMLENIAPNVRELQLFRDDIAEIRMDQNGMLRLPRFRRLKSVVLRVPGPRWSDLIYEIAAWFARDEKLAGEIADHPACQDDHASASFSVTSSPPSPSSATRADRWENWKNTRIRFDYPVRKGEVDWRKLESAVLGEDFEAERLDGEYDCAGFGNHGGGAGRNDVNELMGINRGKGGCSRRLSAGSLWVEVGHGSAGLGELKGELARLDQLGLLQVSCR